MRLMVAIVSFFVLLGCRTRSEENIQLSEGSSALSPIEEEIAKILALKDLAYSGDFSHSEEKEASKDFDAVVALEEVVTNPKFPFVRNLAIQTLAEIDRDLPVAKHSLNHSEFISKYLLTCSNFSECGRNIKTLAAFSDSHPELLIGSRPEGGVAVDGAIVKMRRSVESLENALARKILNFRLDSLEVLAQVISDAGMSESRRIGMTPRVEVSAITGVEKRLLELDRVAAELMTSAKPSFYDLILQNPASVSSLPEEQSRIVELTTEGLLEAIRRTHLGNVSLGYYLKRINISDQYGMTNDPTRWLQFLKSGAASKEAAILTLERFSKWELVLPWRREYVQTLQELAEALPVDDASRAGYLAVSAGIAEKLSALEESSQAFWKGHSLDQVFKNYEGAEKRMATSVKFFHSISYQISRVNDAAHNLTNSVGQLVDLTKDEAPQAISDALTKSRGGSIDVAKKNLESATEQYLSAWIVLQCQLHISRFTAPSTTQIVAVFPIDQSNVDLNQVCPQQPAADFSDIAGEARLRRFIDDKVMQRTALRRWTPVIIEASASAASIPFMFMSGGLVSAVFAPIKKFAIRSAVQLTAEVTTDIIVRKMLTKFTLRVSFSLIQGGLYALTNRALNVAFANLVLARLDPSAERKFLDTSKGFLGNGGRELITGSMGYFFQPLIEPMATAIGQKVATSTNFLRSDVYQGVATKMLTSGANAGFYASITTLTNLVLNQIAPNSAVPVFRNWRELSPELSRDAALNMAAAIKHELESGF